MSAAKTGVNEKVETQTASTALGSARIIPPSQSDFAKTDLRQTAGNFAVQRLLRSGAVQAKLYVGSPGDAYEQEADRVADQMMSPSQVPAVQHKCAACQEGANCPKCEERERLQTKEAPGHTPHVTQDVESSLASLRGSGQPLSPSIRALFEPRFGRDFNEVRVHADAQGAKTASAINARAFTVGKNIVFGADQYSPNTRDGQLLLAHELTHVVQQEGSAGGPIQRAPVVPPTPQKLPPGVLDASYFLLQGNLPKATGTVQTQVQSSGTVRILGPRLDWTETISMAKDSPTGHATEVGFMQTLMSSSRQAIYQSGPASFKYTIRTPQSRDVAFSVASEKITGSRGRPMYEEGEEVRSPGGFYADTDTVVTNASGIKEAMKGRASLSTNQGASETINMFDQPSFTAPTFRDGAALTGTAGKESFRLSVVAKEPGKAPVPLKNYDWDFDWSQSINVSVPSGPTATGGTGINLTQTPDGAPQLEGDPPHHLGKAWYEFADLAAAKSASTDILIMNLTLAKAAGDLVSHGFTVEALKARNPALTVNVTCTETASWVGKDKLEVSVLGAARSGATPVVIGKDDTTTVKFNLLDVYPDPAAIDGGSKLKVIIAVASDIGSPSGSVSAPYPFRPIPLTTLEIGNLDAGTYLVIGFLS
ncbi:MAG: DUF4157 domain-containing protein [Blastocatellia bacterium]